jgi:hypothetical protein
LKQVLKPDQRGKSDSLFCKTVYDIVDIDRQRGSGIRTDCGVTPVIDKEVSASPERNAVRLFGGFNGPVLGP